ncbi:MAG TPA: oligosaccharide flippase family protein [Baekduia sp.]|uniref:oligosaccharide flippase family protein n=1 Tax=Baekduia sp. TaxID=2600305 RepID=UPI002C3043C8|nr:oligosaccharide flippase family protein [Baekduia sp.]HMJ34651.1 oligosaccharide flippase family protein [Baekduia sp.]
MEEKAVRGVSWTFLGLAVSKTVTTLTTLILARLVDPADFGLMAIGLIVVNFLFWFGGISFGATLVVHQELDRRQQGTVLTLALLGTVAATAVSAGLAPVAASVMHEPELTGVLLALSVAVLIGGPASFYESLMQSQLEFRRRFAALAVQTASFAAVAIPLAALGAGVWSLVVGQLVSMGLFAIVLVALAPYRVAPSWDREVARTVFGTGRGFFTQGVTVFIRQNVDTVAVGRSFGATAIGYYSMAFRFGDLTYSAIADPIARVTFPAFARSRAADDDVRPAFLTVIRIVALATVPFGVLLSAAGAPFTALFFGPDWAPMAGVLAVVGLWAAVRPVESTLSWLLNSLGRAGAVGWVSVVVLVPLIVGLVVAVQSRDLRLVACVPLADTLISFSILTVLVQRHAAVSPRDLWSALRGVALCGAVDWAVTRVVADALAGQGAFVALALALAAGLGAFLVGLVVVDRELLATAVRQVARVAGRGAPAATR